MPSKLESLRKIARRVGRALPTYWADPKLAVRRLQAVLRPSAVTFRKVDYFGMPLILLANEDIGWQIVSGAGFEKAELTALDRLIRPDDVCLDIGGNVGIYAAYFARRATCGRVVSFEPIPLNAALIEVNAALNACENVVVERCAVADFDGTSDFVVGTDAAYSSLRSTGRVGDSAVRKVKVITLDGWLRDSQIRPSVIKVDVEGAELAVLRGAKTTLSDPNRRPRLLMVETNERNQAAYQTSPGEVVAFMRDHGYEPQSILASGAVVPGWPVAGAVEDILFKTPAT
jgi:FkbM family methyltransferase